MKQLQTSGEHTRGIQRSSGQAKTGYCSSVRTHDSFPSARAHLLNKFQHALRHVPELGCMRASKREQAVLQPRADCHDMPMFSFPQQAGLRMSRKARGCWKFPPHMTNKLISNTCAETRTLAGSCDHHDYYGCKRGAQLTLLD